MQSPTKQPRIPHHSRTMATADKHRGHDIGERRCEIGNCGPSGPRRGVLFRHDAGSTLGSDGIRGAPQEGLCGSEVEGRESRTLVLGLPSTVALVIARRPRLASAHQAQNFLKHSLPEPSSALQSAAVALELGVI